MQSPKPPPKRMLMRLRPTEPPLIRIDKLRDKSISRLPDVQTKRDPNAKVLTDPPHGT